jgi:hypothetical protein
MKPEPFTPAERVQFVLFTIAGALGVLWWFCELTAEVSK